MINPQQTPGQQRRAVAEVLMRVRRELERLELWESTPPAKDRLSSDQPFCWDTLGFHQWLQWRFLPRVPPEYVTRGQAAWQDGLERLED